MKISSLFLLLQLTFLLPAAHATKTDTLRVMAYNVLYYGNGCQGPNGRYHEYMRTIVRYANPDILCLDKMASIPLSKDDKYGTAPYGFADSILQYALNSAFPDRYNYCPMTNAARSSSMTMLFYDQNKLGYIGIVCSYSNITDFTTYKLYYRDPALAETHDTTFLYVIPIHDLSGDDNVEVRGTQIAEHMKCVREHFSALPNMINLGDFNLRGSEEPLYQLLTANTDKTFLFYDPPFFPDKRLQYPASWDHNADFASYLTTSTRESATIPNPCGTGGGAKGWYDHILLSGAIVNNYNHIGYLANSYHTIGNDGQRFKVSVNDKTAHVNSAAPEEVVEALYQMSNKYPVTLTLVVNEQATEEGRKRTERAGGRVYYKNEATITGLEKGKLAVHFPDDLVGQSITLTCTNDKGETKLNKKFKITDADMKISCKLDSGSYVAKLVGHHYLIAEKKVTQE